MREITNYPIQNKRQCVRNKTTESKWQNLPMDVAFLIQGKLFEHVDHICFSSVCKEWLSLSRDYKEATQREGKILPLFWKTTHCESKGVVSISSEKRYGRFLLPVTYGECCGSSHGWLAKVDRVGLSLSIALVYPFRKSVAPIFLPPMNFLAKTILGYERLNHTIKCKGYIRKVILSADPNLHPGDYLVVVLYDSDSKLALVKGGQGQRKDWIYLDRRLVHLRDVAFYKDQILVVGCRGRILSFHVNDCNARTKQPKVKRLTSLSPFKNNAANSYLVKSSKGGHLWHVRRIVWNRYKGTPLRYKERFKVYKVVVDVENGGGDLQLEEVDSVGDETLFLGGSSSLSVSASDFPGCKPNSIYYTNYDTPCSKHGSPFRIFSFVCKNELLPCESAYHTWLPGGFWILPQFN